MVNTIPNFSSLILVLETCDLADGIIQQDIDPTRNLNSFIV